MNLKTAFVFINLVALETIIGFLLSMRYECAYEFDYKCYSSLTFYQYVISYLNLVLLGFYISNVVINDVLNDEKLSKFVHEYIHYKTKEIMNPNETEIETKTETEMGHEPEFETEINKELFKSNNNSKMESIDINKSIEDFTEMISSLAESKIENESK